jgi:hypothetical protein
MRHKRQFYILCPSPTTYIYGPTLLSLPSLSHSYPFWLSVDGGGERSFTLTYLKIVQILGIFIIFPKVIIHTLHSTTYKMHCSQRINDTILFLKNILI